MLKNDLMHSHYKVRSACKKLICAVNDNPSAFDGLEFVKKERQDQSKINSFRDIGFFGMAAILFSKLLGWH